MSAKYQNSKDVPDATLADRLDELSDVVSKNRDRIDAEFTMRIPAECDRDADIVMAEAARRLRERPTAQPSAEPMAWAQSDHSYDPERHGMQRRLSWKKLESDDAPLYAHPPAAELEALRRDAARYRWLRDDNDNDNDTSELYAVRIDYWSDEYRGQAACEIIGGDYLDLSIDAAMAQQEAP